MSEQLHGGFAVSRVLKAQGVRYVFTLSGGHVFPIFDACHKDGIDLVDVRHEQTAGYAAEGWARLTRSLGVVVVTAGPGVTNVLSPLAQAGFNGAPVLTLAGRAPMFRWGQGSLQEIDHVPFVAPLADARTVTQPDAIAEETLAASTSALTAPRGPAFVDFPLDVLFSSVTAPEAAAPTLVEATGDDRDAAAVARLIETSERPVMVAGSNVWLDRAEGALRALAEAAEIPVFMNGQGRGLIPADHRLAFSRARSTALKEADLVIVAGTKLDFRIGFGHGFAADAKVVHLESHESLMAGHVRLAAGIAGSLRWSLGAVAAELSSAAGSGAWLSRLAAVEEQKDAAVQAELTSTAEPIHPMRIYGELRRVLDRDAVVIGDGGDFVSYAGRELPSYEGGRWLDPGPFGCLGCGPGYALAARLAHPDAQVILLYGDGAFGFSGTELETLVRHRMPVVCIVGNNGIWGLEKHPMRALYGYDVVAELAPGIRYDLTMESFGGKGELVTDPEGIRPALQRALDAGEPYLVNVITDPEIAYPRSAVLA